MGWERSSIREVLRAPTATTKTDMAVFILGEAHVLDVFGRLMMLGASMISGGWIHDLLDRSLGVTIGAGFLPTPLQVVLYFFVYTFFDYWTHRVDHSRWFWPLHRLPSLGGGVLRADLRASASGVLLLDLPHQRAAGGAGPRRCR